MGSGGNVVFEWLLIALAVASVFVTMWIGVTALIEHRRRQRELGAH